MNRDGMRELYSHLEAIARLLSGGGDHGRGDDRRDERMDDRDDCGPECSDCDEPRRDDRGFGMREGWGDEERRIIDAIVNGVSERLLSELRRAEGCGPPRSGERGGRDEGGRHGRHHHAHGHRSEHRSHHDAPRSRDERDQRSHDRGGGPCRDGCRDRR